MISDPITMENLVQLQPPVSGITSTVDTPPHYCPLVHLHIVFKTIYFTAIHLEDFIKILSKLHVPNRGNPSRALCGSVEDWPEPNPDYDDAGDC